MEILKASKLLWRSHAVVGRVADSVLSGDGVGQLFLGSVHKFDDSLCVGSAVFGESVFEQKRVGRLRARDQLLRALVRPQT